METQPIYLCSNCGHKRRRGLPQFNFIAIIMVVFVVLVGFSAAYLAVAKPADDTALSIPAAREFQICPVQDCSGYPRPSKIKGITISSLQGYLLFTKAAAAQIAAVHCMPRLHPGCERHHWQGNTVRLQIEQDKLVGENGNKLNAPYAKIIKQVVGRALRYHEYVVLNAQTEQTVGYGLNEPMPTLATFRIWRYFTGLYGTFPHVVFDLFNEPRESSWDEWKADFQSLVNYIRRQGSENQLWVEGRTWGSTLRGVPLLNGRGLVYSYHHPGCPHQYQCPVTEATWWDAFGNLAYHGVPVVNGEFVNFTGGYVWAYATETVTKYLLDLHKWHIGVIAWSLQPGIMTTGLDLGKPIPEPQGAGMLVWRDFHGTLAKATEVKTNYEMAEGRLSGHRLHRAALSTATNGG